MTCFPGKAFFAQRCWLLASLSAACLLALLPEAALAQNLSLNMGPDTPGGPTVTGRIVQLMGLLTVLSIAPGILMITTSFTRIIIVLSLLRSALGTQTVPPNTVLLSLALFLTGFIMAPTFEKAYNDGIKPLMAQQMDEMTAFQKTVDPFKDFMLKNVREKDLALFTDLSKQGPFPDPHATPLQILVPSFVISEMRRGFEIGFLLFIPFIIIDMVTASLLMAMGMVTLPPVTISLPFKLIFFVLIDGWYLISGSLIRSYG